METRVPRLSLDRRFFTWAAIAAVLIVFAGFAKTYYLKGIFGTPALPGLVHLHGLVMTSWFALFVIQVRLVAAGNVRVHRRLGVAGGILAVLILAVGTLTAIHGARLGHTPGPPPLVFLAIPFGDLAVFAGLVGAGLANRNRPDVHRRLMLLSALGILTPAIARIPLDFIKNGGPMVYFGLTDLCVVACVAIDTWRNRRLHPAFLWGSLTIIASQPIRLLVAGTGAWLKIATWLAG